MSQVADRADVQTLDNFIGGRWVKASATEFSDVHNPAVGDVIGRTPLSTSADVDAAVDRDLELVAHAPLVVGGVVLLQDARQDADGALRVQPDLADRHLTAEGDEQQQQC